MLNPCKLRWTKYNDYYTGKELLGACLASFELESSGAKTSCNGGLEGLGERGDRRVPKLIGVGCVDMNLVVDLPTLESHPGYNDFWAEVQSDMKACPLNSLTESQMETLRAEAGGASARCSTPPPTWPDHCTCQAVTPDAWAAACNKCPGAFCDPFFCGGGNGGVTLHGCSWVCASPPPPPPVDCVDDSSSLKAVRHSGPACPRV